MFAACPQRCLLLECGGEDKNLLVLMLLNKLQVLLLINCVEKMLVILQWSFLHQLLCGSPISICTPLSMQGTQFSKKGY
jgi:hypothetical protein